MMDASQAFGTVSAAYARYRPSYPPSLYTAILDSSPHLGRGNRRAVAVDVACGSAQASLHLAALFDRVVALDSCEQQVEQARAALELAASASAATKEQPCPSPAARRVELRVADAHDTRLPDSSADLITVAQALHWLDVPVFAQEAARVLKPHGTLAAWSYGLARVVAVAGGGGGGSGGCAGDGDEDDGMAAGTRPAAAPPLSAGEGAAEAADAAVRRLYSALERFWDERRFHVDDGYARLAPLLQAAGSAAAGAAAAAGKADRQQQQREAEDDGQGGSGPFSKVETQRLEMRAWKSVEELVGYVESWSALGRLRDERRRRRQQQQQRREEEQEEEEGEEEEEQEDPVAAFRRELLLALGGAEDASLELVTPVALVLASGPHRLPPSKQQGDEEQNRGGAAS
jgi:SAM-dependent methyltransferase